MILERLDDFVDELAVRRRVPAEPVASVAVETLAVEDGWLVVVLAGFVLLRCRRGSPAVSSRDQVSENLSVFGRENRD